MTDSPKKTIVIPCSGIGKSFGSVSREAAYSVTEDLRPEETQIVPLALLVMGDAESQRLVHENPCITIDGCKYACATAMTRQCEGTITKDFTVLEALRRHREFKPQGIAELNEGGLKLAQAMAQEIVACIDQSTEEK